MNTFAEFVDEFQDGQLHDIVRLGKRYFYDPTHLSEEVNERGWEVTSIGLFLGEEKSWFRPSPALLDLLQTEKKVVIDEKSAEQFLYGKDVLMKGVVRASGEGYVLVTDIEGNVLGYGKTANPLEKEKENKLFIRNLLDRGNYLRREN